MICAEDVRRVFVPKLDRRAAVGPIHYMHLPAVTVSPACLATVERQRVPWKRRRQFEPVTYKSRRCQVTNTSTLVSVVVVVQSRIELDVRGQAACEMNAAIFDV